MSCSELAIRCEAVSKSFAIYERPSDRLKQSIYPRIQRCLGRDEAKYFREFWALKDVSFDLPRGQAFGIVGRNGSGKSTLLQLIAGVLTPTSGALEVNGKVGALLELGSGFNPDFTGRENIYLNATLLGLSRAQVEARFDAIAAFADIGDFLEQPVKTYSSGMVVRLAFAVMANVEPDILIVDEALAVGDGVFVQKCMRFIRRFIESGTLLFVSHDIASVKSLCASSMWLHEGRVRSLSSAKDVANDYLKFLYEKTQGEFAAETKAQASSCTTPPVKRDMRAEFLARSGLLNEIKVFDFVPGTAGFGTGSVRVLDVCLTDEKGNQYSWIVGGEEVSIQISLEASAGISSPIVGFIVKDRLGQSLFADNTHLYFKDCNLEVGAGEQVVVKFSIRMPILPKGQYSVDVAVAEGVQAEHVQHAWLHDVLMFTSMSDSVCTGLMGVPVSDVEFSSTRRSWKASEL